VDEVAWRKWQGHHSSHSRWELFDAADFDVTGRISKLLMYMYVAEQ